MSPPPAAWLILALGAACAATSGYLLMFSNAHMLGVGQHWVRQTDAGRGRNTALGRIFTLIGWALAVAAGVMINRAVG